MNVSEAVQRRTSIRAFKPDPVAGSVVRELLEGAHRAPSGGNLQPWRVFALTGAPLAELKAVIAAKNGRDPIEYDIYPPDLWDPFRTRRFQCGEDLYATIGVAREDKAGRLRQFAKNGEFFGAPVGLFFFLDRKLGPPQWSDVGMYMQTLMLLAVERGLATCAQEFWSVYNRTVSQFVGASDELMLFSGMALGYPDESAPINTLRTRRDPFEAWATMKGFD
ncbi:MAG TPA: nitroreductase [Burkholderiaceae bacterium]|nr:nitroreductase [Burkholderiaceae bacterium]